MMFKGWRAVWLLRKVLNILWSDKVSCVGEERSIIPITNRVPEPDYSIEQGMAVPLNL